MADHSKFGNNALLSFCALDRLSAIVTDQPLPDAFLSAAEDFGIRVITPE